MKIGAWDFFGVWVLDFGISLELGAWCLEVVYMSDSHTALAEQFDDLPQQKEASILGMWTFLATEVLFFGGMFMSYITYRHAYPQVFAQASRHTILC